MLKVVRSEAAQETRNFREALAALLGKDAAGLCAAGPTPHAELRATIRAEATVGQLLVLARCAAHRQPASGWGPVGAAESMASSAFQRAPAKRACGGRYVTYMVRT